MLVAGRYGSFEIPDEKDLVANSLRLYGEWAQTEIDALGNFIEEGSVVVDVGAFIGTHSRAFSGIVGTSGKVYAFEPNSSIYLLLEENAKKASLRNIITLPFALGARGCKMCIANEPYHNNQGATHLDTPSDINDQKGVEVKLLDSFDIGPIDFIKVDVEGMELEVLMGGEEAINNHTPTIFLEVNSLEDSAGILGWARHRNYLTYGLIGDAFNPFNFNGAKKNIFGPAAECGLLLIHEDNVGKFVDHIERLQLAKVRTIDDLALLLLHKFQYVDEVLAQSIAASKLGIGYSSPEQRRTWCFKLHRNFDKYLLLLKRRLSR
ncbi:methyltransferase, FkbM family [Nitrosospira sp. Nsp11]|uniref:FkbM family methyltransferase n=1 Tax=Nitrosospira sp. Nsp11 TaxID=1855338 RepID=UPI00091C8A80|nr:FkbM family methyltransferase [Nitrosospira sp. Nsp11]SHL69617.1 methyltransferase, FkbM family [Nitrosospira sp. Nsp11]